MPLFLAPVQLQDFDVIEKHADIYEPGDDLVAPPFPISWPVATQAEAQSRLRFAMAKQKQRFREDTTARFIKVVDAASEAQVHEADIIGIARWHYYESGYDYASMFHWEMSERLPGEGWPPGLNREVHDFILSDNCVTRKDWIGEGKPAWILTGLVTRRSHRGRGAAAMLIKWGIEESERSGVPAYLEAGAQGLPIYVKYGFEQVGGLIQLDLRSYGLDMAFELTKMVRFPKSRGP